jgi:hypothetical protein
MAKYENAEASGRSTKDIVNCWNERNKNELKNDLPTVSSARQMLLLVLMINIVSKNLAMRKFERKNGKNGGQHG